jgi:hypothetical protein
MLRPLVEVAKAATSHWVGTVRWFGCTTRRGWKLRAMTTRRFFYSNSRPTTPARRRGKSGRCRRSYRRHARYAVNRGGAFTEFNKASGGPTARVDVISPHSVPRKDEARPAQIPAGLLIALSLSQSSRECTPDCTCTHAPDNQQYSIRFIGFAMEQRVVYIVRIIFRPCQMYTKLISI